MLRRQGKTVVKTTFSLPLPTITQQDQGSKRSVSVGAKADFRQTLQTKSLFPSPRRRLHVSYKLMLFFTFASYLLTFRSSWPGKIFEESILASPATSHPRWMRPVACGLSVSDACLASVHAVVTRPVLPTTCCVRCRTSCK